MEKITEENYIQVACNNACIEYPKCNDIMYLVDKAFINCMLYAPAHLRPLNPNEIEPICQDIIISLVNKKESTN